MNTDTAVVRALHDRLNGSAGRTDTSERTGSPVPPSGPAIALPAPHGIDDGMSSLLHARRSRYDFDQEASLPLSTLASLLGNAVGIGRRVEAYGDARHPLGLAPTAGGLRSREVYVFAARVDGLEPALYGYDMDDHCVHTLRAGDPVPALSGLYAQPEFAHRPAVTIALTARLDVALQKYSIRHYRTLHVDAGIAVQNLYLAATGLGLAVCAVSGFDDHSADTVLGLGPHAITTMMIAAGPPRAQGCRGPQ